MHSSSLAESGVEPFMCGVVEGFYGRPWTLEQRKDLFTKLQEWGMNSYLYAPKDDYKHRAYWRELYSVEEADHLTSLIAACKESNITFFYALSPGLDITYSSQKEMAILKRKLDQVAQFGCTAFALLFDDIEPEMTESDKEAFQSFAQAQVSVTNEIYDYLNQPKGFLFCPTQYCASRAVPDVRNSEYLNTVGSKLAPGIDIMWTGPKVISRFISPASIDELSDVLRRKPVIWDNLHANDYDQKRLFLGPYSGRPASLLSKLKGVLTNPNCEYGANFVAIHSLAQWSKCSSDSQDGDEQRRRRGLSGNESISADIQLEQEDTGGRAEDESPAAVPAGVYHPQSALRKSLLLWLPEFKRTKSMWGPISKPHVTNVPPVNFGGSSPPVPSSSSVEEPQGDAALATGNIQVDGTESAESASMVSAEEPMDALEAAPSPSKNLDVEEEEEDEAEPDVVMGNGKSEEEQDIQLTVEDLTLLCHLFYLPFEHGPQGMQLLHEFNWLKINAHLAGGSSSTSPTTTTTTTTVGPDHHHQVREWQRRADRFDSMSRSLNRLFTRLTYINNRELLYELYPYVWDMRGVVALLNSYVKWLACHQGSKQGFLSGEQEPWVFRGGLAADLQRLLPVESVSDLFLYKIPETPTRQVYTIRPYLATDERAVYELARRLHAARMGASPSLDCCDPSLSHPDLVGDIYFGAFMTLSPELCFVVEDDQSVVGFAAAAADAKELRRRIRIAWIPELQSKYPELAQWTGGGDCSSNIPEGPLKELVESLRRIQGDLPEGLLAYHPSQLKMGLSDSVVDHSVSKRLLTCAVAALRAHGSSGCHVQDVDALSVEFYSRLGFVEVKSGGQDDSDAPVYFGRIF